MSRCGWMIASLLLVAGLGQSVGAEPPPPLVGSHVVVRGKTDLADALDAALHPLLSEQPAMPVLLVVDLSPNVRSKRDVLQEALGVLDAKYLEVTSWRVALLGEGAGASVARPSKLGAEIRGWSQGETKAISTIEALALTIKQSKIRKTAIAYLNDWRFEDDARLEEFIKDLRRSGNRLSVVGTEAAFGRAWNDGWVSASDRFDMSGNGGFEPRDYYEEVGRSPFAKGDHEAPWHGGDTAYPHAPYRWHTFLWNYEFTEFDFTFAASDGVLDLGPLGGEDGKPPEFEDLDGRMKDGGGLPGGDDGKNPLDDPEDAFRADASRLFPIPAAYGPYGLMRSAAMTGGRYVLWSWNPGGRRKVHYDYSRCNLFPPDLRSRKEILGALRRAPVGLAMIQAWCALEAAGESTISHSAPLKKNGKSPRSIDRFPSAASLSLPFSWDNKADWQLFQDGAKNALAALTKAGQILDKALAKVPKKPETPTLKRYRADADLFRHVVRCVHLEIAEGLAASNDLPKDAWKDSDKIPGVGGRTWISRGLDPEKVRVEERGPVDAEAGAAVLEERKLLLGRYRGTPFAEIIGLNDVEPLRFVWWERGGRMPDIGRSPTESTGRPRPGGPGAPSAGGGPTTGK